MSFKLGDLIVDRIIMGTAEGSDGKLLYTLTNLQDATIEISSESTDAVDGTGAVIKTFYRGKTGTLTATNSTLNLPIIEAMGGSDAVFATSTNPLTMPRIQTVEAGKTLTLTGYEGTNGSDLVLNAINDNGSLDRVTEYSYSATADATHYSISGGVLTPPTAEGVTAYIVKYNRSVTDGAYLANRSDTFPKTVKLTLKVLIVEPCEPDVVRACYVVIPSFQPQADLSFGFTTDGTIDFSGNLQISYCGAQKVLYEIYMAADDEEEE